MNLRDWLLTALGTAILVALIVLIATPKNNSIVSGTSTANQNNAGDDMSAMHGGGKPANTTTFNGLTGKIAPDFTLTDYNGNQITLSKLRGQDVVLFFNEGLMCYPACWNQVAAFGKDAQFKDKNTVVLNIVVDSKDKWQEAVTKMPDLASATVLLDTDKKVSSAYGVLNLPSSMHRGQYPGHSYVIIDKSGVVRITQDDPEMAVRNKELVNEINALPN